jgi:hypothetical protein
MPLRDDLLEALRVAVGGRPVVLLGRLPKSALAPMKTLEALGAGPFLLVTLRSGRGQATPGTDRHVLRAGAADPDFIIEVADFERRLRAPDAGLRGALAAFDPGAGAIVVGPNHLDCPGLLGRPRLGGRRPLDLRLEDKTTIDGLWAALGLPHLPSRVVPTTPGALAAASAALDGGHGVVWAGDNSSAVEGGAIATRWVGDARTQDHALAVLRPRCERARVMPYQPGLPMSVHAWCLARGVAVLSPMEMVVLRNRRTGAFRFAGCATTWTPPDAAVQQIRGFATRVARHLHEEQGYRGALSIDGVLGPGGFVPTELNARFPAGLSQLAHTMDDTPLALADAVIRQGGLEDLSPAHLQVVLRAQLARAPIAWLHSATPRAPSMSHGIGLIWGPGGFRRAGPGEPASSTLDWESGQVGGALRLRVLAPPRGVTGAALFTGALAAAGPPLAAQLSEWDAAQAPS